MIVAWRAKSTACAAATGLRFEGLTSLRESDMIHGDTKKDDRPPVDDRRLEDEDDETPVKRPQLGKLKTDEEDRLAAEIEKLRR